MPAISAIVAYLTASLPLTQQGTQQFSSGLRKIYFQNQNQYEKYSYLIGTKKQNEHYEIVHYYYTQHQSLGNVTREI